MTDKGKTVDRLQACIYALFAEKNMDIVKMSLHLAMESMPAGREQDALTELVISVNRTFEALSKLNGEME